MEYVSLADIDTPVPMRNAGLLLSILARLEGPNVCCRIAFDSDIMELGPIGAIALAAPTPRLALEAVSMNMASHSTHEVISVESTSACITVGYGCSVRFEPIVLHLIQQYTASLIYRLISVTANDEPPFTSVSMFPHPEHGLTHLSKWFQVQPRTELDGYMRIEVPARLANKAFRISGDRVVGAYGKLNLDRIDTSLEGTIESILQLHLGTGKPSIDRLAIAAGCSRRTLQRALAERNLTFSDLLDDVRRQIATKELANQSVSRTDLARALGYSRQSTLSHAMRRWKPSSDSKKW